MTAVYGDYDQAGLDAQYNLRAAVPSFPQFVEAWAARSAALRAETDVRADIAYGQGPREVLDFFPAAAAGPRPVHVFIHGGYWQSMDKDHFGYLLRAGLAAGVHGISLDYALCPDVDLESIVDQVRRALAFVWRNADELGIDRARIVVSGHSAGGHLVSMAALTDWAAAVPDCADLRLAGALSISGLYDLEPIRLSYLNGVLGLDPASARRNSPLIVAQELASAPPSAPPLVLALGGLETDEFQRQQAAFADTGIAAGLSVETLVLPGRHHFDVIDGLDDPRNPLFQRIFRDILD